MIKTFSIIAFCFFLIELKGIAQHSSIDTIPLEDMSAFEQQAGNWLVAKDVTIDPNVDIHQSKEESKKKRKGKKESVPQAVVYKMGTGVLLNLPDDQKKDNLITKLNHGDIELELEVMLPKGSNSGIYLQGRYEIQLLDSWGVSRAGFSDIGGIYRNWESDPEKSYMGKAPLTNAAKAPGLWQKMKISFQAPRFDPDGKKIANARIHYVDLNGVRIHENVEIPKLTGGAIGQEEVAEGPLMIQGDHGPVAIRNIRYKLMKDPDIKLNDLEYTVFAGTFNTPEEVEKAEPKASGSIAQLTYLVTDEQNNFGIVFSGELEISASGQYFFQSTLGGSGALVINNDRVMEGFQNISGNVYLDEGTHSFRFIYYKSVSWQNPRLSLTVAGENTYPMDLHAFSSSPPDQGVVSPIYIDVKDKPRLLRAFLDYEGKRSQRLTHTIGVGEAAIHYVYNMQAGNLACLWRGDFVDATPMWHDRGDGSFVPRGMIQYLSAGPAIAELPEELTPFPSSVSGEVYKGKGYALDSAGRPTFSYLYNDIEVSDKIYPDETSARFLREVSFSNVDERTFFKLAEGSEVEELSQNTFIIGDKEYYITLITGQEPVVRMIDGKKELLVPVENRRLIYSITW